MRDLAMAPKLQLALGLLWVATTAAFASSAVPLRRALIPYRPTTPTPRFALVADGGNLSDLRQYVPLLTCSLVLADIALGRPVANGIAATLFKVLVP